MAAWTRPYLLTRYDTAFWWSAGIFAGGAVIAGALLRPRAARSGGHALPGT